MSDRRCRSGGTSNGKHIEACLTDEKSPFGEIPSFVSSHFVPDFARLNRRGCCHASDQAGSNMTFRVQQSAVDDAVVLVLSGDIAGDHTAELETLVDAGGNGSVVLDLKDVSVVDRAGA